MGVRNLYSIDVDKVTGKIAAAWVGPDQGTNSTDLGPGEDRERRDHHLGRQLRLAVLHGQPAGLPREAPGQHRRRPRRAGRPPGHGRRQRPAPPAPVAAATGTATTRTGILNTSPYNTGLERIPAARPTNIWYGPQGGCYDFARNANDIPNYNGTNTAGRTPTPPASYRRCPFVFGGGQAPMTGGFYRKPAG